MHVPPPSICCQFPRVARIGCCRPCEDRTATDPPSAPPTARKLYAPSPVGEPTPIREQVPPQKQERVVRIDYFYLNAGERLDVLA